MGSVNIRKITYMVILLLTIPGCISPVELRWANMIRDYYFLCMEREGFKHDPKNPNKACDEEAQEKLKEHLRGN